METLSAIAGLQVNKPRGFIVMVEAEQYQSAQPVPPIWSLLNTGLVCLKYTKNTLRHN